MAEPFFSTPKKIQTEYEKQKELEGNNVESDSQIEDNNRSIQLLWKSVGEKNTTLVSKVSQTFHAHIVSYWVVDSGGGWYTVDNNASSFYNPDYSKANALWYAQQDPSSGNVNYYPYIIPNSWYLSISCIKELELPNIDLNKYAISIQGNWTVPSLAITNRKSRCYITNHDNPGMNNWVYGTISSPMYAYNIINNKIMIHMIMSAAFYPHPVAGDYIYTIYIYATEL